MNLLIATNNIGKVHEYQQILGELFPDLSLLTLREAGIEYDVEETGQTFEANARLKALTYAKMSGMAVIADDSGLAVDAFDGFPGVYSNRWAGPTDEDRNQQLLKKMTNIPAEKRGAKFVCIALFCLPNGREVLAKGEVIGSIGYQAQGEHGFGYDPLFVLPDLGRTMAQLSKKEKNAISHRGRAARALAPQMMALMETGDW